MKEIPLTNTARKGTTIPQLGLGTWQANGKEAEDAVYEALKAGYRHIDTAKIYGNEKQVGNAIRKAIQELGIKREEIFVTTKLWNDDHDNPLGAFNESLKKLGLDYIDLYLIHWPVSQALDSWKTLQVLLKDQKVRALGVSNFMVPHLKTVIKKKLPLPCINQVEYSPYLQNETLRTFCQKHHIVLEAYSPLTRGKKLNDLQLVHLARNYNKTPAQLLIAWALQKNIVAIPKSTNPKRIKENIEAVQIKLSEKDMSLISNLDVDFRTCWDPNTIDGF